MIIKSTLNFIAKNLRFNLVHPFAEQLLYIERPFLTDNWYTERASLKDALHSTWLMAKGVVPFSYNGYEWACGKAILNQAQLTKQDLLMLMQLGVQYHVRLSTVCDHIQNEIFLRIHRDYELQIQDYDQQIKQQMKKFFAKLQSKSEDYFHLLKDQQDKQIDLFAEDESLKIDEQEGEDGQQDELSGAKDSKANEESVQSQTNKFMLELTDKLKQRKQKEFSLEDLLKVSRYLKDWNSTNLKLIQYLQQLLTIKLQDQKVDTSTALTYLQFLTFACQSLKMQYQNNQQRYTRRSLKRIFKYQDFYFHEHFRQLTTVEATPQFVEELVHLYAAFPIKKRLTRKKLGMYIGSQMQKLGMLERNDLKTILLGINGKDEKMKRSYREFLHLPEEQVQRNELKSGQKQDQDGQPAAVEEGKQQQSIAQQPVQVQKVG